MNVGKAIDIAVLAEKHGLIHPEGADLEDVAAFVRELEVGMVTPDKLAPPAPAPDSMLRDILDGGHIERYHLKGKRMIARQNVAEHSWRMAAMVYYIWPEATPALIWATLFHDVSERVTGDIPGNIKATNYDIRKVINEVSTNEEVRLGIRFKLTEEEQKVLAFVDRFEGALYCWTEMQMGNRLAIPTFNRYIGYCKSKTFVLNQREREQRRESMLSNLVEQAQLYIGD